MLIISGVLEAFFNGLLDLISAFWNDNLNKDNPNRANVSEESEEPQATDEPQP